MFDSRARSLDNDSMDNSHDKEVISTTWIENLALEEINMEESGVIGFQRHLDTSAILEEESIRLVDQLRDRFEVYVDKFNEYRKTGGSNIRIFKISNTVNDFMLFRNSLKLVIARRSNDVISIGFLSNSGGLFSARLSPDAPPENRAHEIRAAIGAFNKITWHFMGEPIDVDALVRHYLTDFIQNSAR